MKKCLFLFLLFPILLFSQNQIQGLVTDSSTKKPLPFASIITNTNKGTLTDVDGKFYIKSKTEFNEIKVSYVGYKTVLIPITIVDKFIKIQLQKL